MPRKQNPNALRRDKEYKLAWQRDFRTSERGREHRRQRIRRNREIVRAAKVNPCADCRVNYPYYVMDFDHCRGTKSFEIREGLTKTITALLREIAKCDVVCANCHRVRTHRRSQYVARTA